MAILGKNTRIDMRIILSFADQAKTKLSMMITKTRVALENMVRIVHKFIAAHSEMDSSIKYHIWYDERCITRQIINTLTVCVKVKLGKSNKVQYLSSHDRFFVSLLPSFVRPFVLRAKANKLICGENGCHVKNRNHCNRWHMRKLRLSNQLESRARTSCSIS